MRNYTHYNLSLIFEIYCIGKESFHQPKTMIISLTDFVFKGTFLPDVGVPHSKSGIVPRSSLLGAGQLGFWEFGRGKTVG